MSSLDEHARAGLKAIEEKRYEDAIASFERAVELAPDRPDMNNALGMAYLHRGDAGNAIGPLERAVALAEPFSAPEHQPLKQEFHLSLATAYQLMDHVAQARETLQGIVQRWPEHLGARLQLAQLLLSACELEAGLAVYDDSLDLLDKDQRESAEALVGTLRAFLESEHPASVFLEAHCDSYIEYFDEVAKAQSEQGWYAEAARMVRGPDGEPVRILPEGARPYAFTRVDLVNPADGTVSGVYSEQEPMVVALEGLEALAQVPVLLPWKGETPFDLWVCSRCPWHWLTVTVQFQQAADTDEALIERVDGAIGQWYLAGYEGEFGDAERGRFHYITDPDRMGDRAVVYVIDLGRARFEAIGALLRRLTVVHDRHPIQRVLFGYGRLPD
jgi:tetratricopeptide (TPR) repeat protein